MYRLIESKQDYAVSVCLCTDCPPRPPSMSIGDHWPRENVQQSSSTWTWTQQRLARFQLTSGSAHQTDRQTVMQVEMMIWSRGTCQLKKSASEWTCQLLMLLYTLQLSSSNAAILKLYYLSHTSSVLTAVDITPLGGLCSDSECTTTKKIRADWLWTVVKV